MTQQAVGPFWKDRREVEYGYHPRNGGIMLRYPKVPKGKAAVKAHKRARRQAREEQRIREAITRGAMEGPQ